MFDDELAPVTAHPAAPEPARSSSDPDRQTEPLSSSRERVWSSSDLTALVEQLASVDLDGPDAERVDQLTALERVKAACAAAQARIIDRFVDSQAELAQDWHARAQACFDADDFDGWRAAREQAHRYEYTPPPGTFGADTDEQDGSSSRGARRASGGIGIAAQVALARRESPTKGTRIVSHALALTRHLPHTLAALSAGLLNEHRASLVARHTSHLRPELQTAVDADVIGAHGEAVGSWGDRELERHVRACADRLDAAAATARARTAESDRRVTLRPIPDTMALLTAVLPVAQAVAVHAALARAAATATANGDPRTRNQIMADTLVALVTGQDAATDVPIEVQVIITDRALFDGDDTAAHIPGYGPVPAAWVRHLLTPDPDDPEYHYDVDCPDTDHAEAEPEDSDDVAEVPDTDLEDLEADAEPEDSDDVAEVPDTDLEDLEADAEPDDREPDDREPDHREPDLFHPDHEGPDQAAGDDANHGDRAGSRPPPHPTAQQPPASAGFVPPPRGFTPPVPRPRQSRRAATWLRRLFTHPATGTLVAMDSRRRTFDAGLRRFLITRDGTCRTPWCDAPIRHLDHVHRHADGGPTTATNGEGLCVRCNLTHEQPGFHTKVIHPGAMTHDQGGAVDAGLDARSREDDGTPHTVELTTPTGHTYTSSAPPVLPGLDQPPPAELMHETRAPRKPETPPLNVPREVLTAFAIIDPSPLEYELQQLLLAS
jgi:hypothetical protein